MILLLVVFTVISCGLGVGIGMFLMGRSKGGGKHEESHDKRALKAQPTVVYSLGDMVVNLADQGALRYARITVAIGFTEKVDDAKLKTYEPLMKDAVINVVTGHRFDELHRKGGIQLIKDDIRKSVMEQVPDLKVGEVYLEAFAMQ